MLRSSFDLTIRAGALTTILALTAAPAVQASTIRSQAAVRTAAAAQAVPQGAAKVTPVFQQIDNPGDPTFNQLLAIDNNGTISGYFGSGMAGHPNQAYIIKAPYTRFMPNNIPTSTQTQVQGYIDGGTSSGFWAPSNTGMDQNFGFVKVVVNGITTIIDVNDPLTTSSPAHPSQNQVLGINKSLNAVGFYGDANGNPHGYLYSVSTGKYIPVNVNGAVSDSALGINANNVICGAFTKADGHTDAFLESAMTGKTITFHVPGFTDTQFLGVNDNGLAVGFYNDANGIPHGVVYNSVTGKYAIVNDPNGVNGTTLNGVNDKNQIVGFYTDAATNTHGILVTGIK